MDMYCEHKEHEILCIRLVGRMDVEGTQTVESPLMEESIAVPSGRVAVDLGELDYLASVGLGCLVHTAQAVTKRQGRLVLINPQPLVSKVLHDTGLNLHVHVFESWPAASQFLQQLPPPTA